jgi:hypothetical protein
MSIEKKSSDLIRTRTRDFPARQPTTLRSNGWTFLYSSSFSYVTGQYCQSGGLATAPPFLRIAVLSRTHACNLSFIGLWALRQRIQPDESHNGILCSDPTSLNTDHNRYLMCILIEIYCHVEYRTSEWSWHGLLQEIWSYSLGLICKSVAYPVREIAVPWLRSVELMDLAKSFLGKAKTFSNSELNYRISNIMTLIETGSWFNCATHWIATTVRELYLWKYHHWQKQPFWAIAFLRRFYKTCL